MNRAILTFSVAIGYRRFCFYNALWGNSERTEKELRGPCVASPPSLAAIFTKFLHDGNRASLCTPSHNLSSPCEYMSPSNPLIRALIDICPLEEFLRYAHASVLFFFLKDATARTQNKKQL